LYIHSLNQVRRGNNNCQAIIILLDGFRSGLESKYTNMQKVEPNLDGAKFEINNALITFTDLIQHINENMYRRYT